MFYDVTDVRPGKDYTLSVCFKDEVKGTVRLLPSFFRGVFAHLKDQAQFQQVMLVDGVVTWPGELDLAPDAMHQAIKTCGEWVLD